jgi:hypothetical protein
MYTDQSISLTEVDLVLCKTPHRCVSCFRLSFLFVPSKTVSDGVIMFNNPESHTLSEGLMLR